MEQLFAHPHAPSLHVFAAALALASVLAVLNSLADRLWRSGRAGSALGCACVAGGASVPLLMLMGFNALQACLMPLAGLPLVVGVFVAKVHLRRALHLPA